MPRRKELSLRGQSEKAGPRYSPRVDGQPRGGRWTAAGGRGERARGARAGAGGPSCPGPSLCSASSPLRKPAPRAPGVQAEAPLGGHSTAELPRVRASPPRLHVVVHTPLPQFQKDTRQPSGSLGAVWPTEGHWAQPRGPTRGPRLAHGGSRPSGSGRDAPACPAPPAPSSPPPRASRPLFPNLLLPSFQGWKRPVRTTVSSRQRCSGGLADSSLGGSCCRQLVAFIAGLLPLSVIPNARAGHRLP